MHKKMKGRQRKAAACFLTAALVLSAVPAPSVLADTETSSETVQQEIREEESAVTVTPGMEVSEETDSQTVPLTEQNTETETQVETETETQTKQETQTETQTEVQSETPGETETSEVETESVTEKSTDLEPTETEDETKVPVTPPSQTQSVVGSDNLTSIPTQNIVPYAAVYSGNGYTWDFNTGILTVTNNDGVENAMNDVYHIYPSGMNLKQIVVGSGVTRITYSSWMNALGGAPNLTSYSIDFSQAINLTEIESRALCLPYITGNINLSNCINLTSIGDMSFWAEKTVNITGCVNLTSIGSGFQVTSSSIWLTSLSVNGSIFDGFDRTASVSTNIGDRAEETITLNAGVLNVFNGASITVSNGTEEVAKGKAGENLTVPLESGANKLTLTVTWQNYSKSYSVQVNNTLLENSITNKNYTISYVHGDSIPEPMKENFNCANQNAALSFVWYKGTTVLTGKPSDPGEYALVVTAPADNQYASAELRLPIIIDSASYHVTIPSDATAGGYAVSITTSNFKVGENGRVRVTVSDGADDGTVTLTRQNTGTENAAQITSQMFNQKENGSLLKTADTVALYDKDQNLLDGTTGKLYFAAPTESNIAAGTYLGTVTFQISYEIASN